MKSSKPYLVRALYEWIVDCDCTPHIVVDVLREGVLVPLQYAKDGQIVLNVSPLAAVGFAMDNQAISFNARFGGIDTYIYVPLAAVLGLYARENGQGMMFDLDDGDENVSSSTPSPAGPSGRPSLRVVK